MATTTSVRIPERYNASLLLDGNVLAGRGEKTAVTCGDVSLSYADVYGRACAYGGALRQFGVDIGERVLLVLDDRPDFPPLFLGTIRAGAVPVPLNPLYGAAEYPYFVGDSRARLVVVDPASADKVVGALNGRFDRSRILVVGGDAAGLTRLEEVAAGQSADVAPADTRRDDMAFWLYSSGSTGRPKGIVHLQRDLLCTCETYARHVLRIDEHDATFSTTKLFHAYGLGNNLSFPTGPAHPRCC